MFTIGLSKKEGICHCGCGKGYLSFIVLLGYTLLRIIYGKPLRVSGYRCVKHNRKVKGSPNSQHTKGNALDIGVPKGYTVETWAAYCKPFFPRILTGYVHPDSGEYISYSTHIHADAKGFVLSISNIGNYVMEIVLQFMKWRKV